MGKGGMTGGGESDTTSSRAGWCCEWVWLSGDGWGERGHRPSQVGDNTYLAKC